MTAVYTTMICKIWYSKKQAMVFLYCSLLLAAMDLLIKIAVGKGTSRVIHSKVISMLVYLGHRDGVLAMLSLAK